MLPCDLCGASGARHILDSPRLDGPLVECRQCGLRYIGARRSQLAFGTASGAVTAERVRAANIEFRNLGLEEERRLARLNARWRVNLIREFRSSGKLLEVGCARGDFLSVARESFDVVGVEPNPDLANSAAVVAPVYCDVVETVASWDFDVAASFHVIEHVDSPSRFTAAIAQRLRPGGLLVLETPDIDSLPFRLVKSRWRQFIPEHYYFFDRRTIARLVTQNGFRVDRIMRVGKHASMDLVANRLSRYFRPLHRVEGLIRKIGLSRLTVRLDPLDIMIVFATKLSTSNVDE